MKYAFIQSHLTEYSVECSCLELEVSRSGYYDWLERPTSGATLKTELVHHQQYATREQARQSVFEYIGIFYNRKRLHSSLDYLSPEAFEAKFN